MPGAEDSGSLLAASSAADAGLSNSRKADGKDAGAPQCPSPVSVTIQLESTVACPGHKLPITAVGTPPDGDYAWTISGAELVDGSGEPVKSGDAVNLMSFRPEDGQASIPERVATVSVTYTHPCGTAKASKLVKIHKIQFTVTNMAQVDAGSYEAKKRSKADSYEVGLESKDPNTAIVSVNPKVTIQLDAACPRKDACAKSFRAGIIQDVTGARKFLKWHHRNITTLLKIGPPLRDSMGRSGDLLDPDAQTPFPFYSVPIPFSLDIDRDSDTVTVNFDDTPELSTMSYPDPDPEKDLTLYELSLQEKFTTWLVVQNTEWPSSDTAGSLVFLKHFTWAVDYTATLDETGKYTPGYYTPETPTVQDGKGAKGPCLTEEIANDPKSWKDDTVEDVPVPKPAPKHRHHK